VRQYANLRQTLTDAAVAYQADVTAGHYPAPEHSYTD
jgi:3-methyl-2-oxobutanoate hydroxymethyltransferase